MQRNNAALLADACLRAVRAPFLPGMLLVLIVSIALTILLLIVLIAGCSWLAGALAPSLSAVPVLASLGAGWIAWLLFPGITPVVVSFFDQRITQIIETHEYPALSPAPPAAFWPEFRHDAMFALKATALNILALPLYLVPLLNLVLFYWLNGRLLGREYFLMVARRHQPLALAITLHQSHQGFLTIAGGLLAFISTIPVVNVLAPFWGIALMVHLHQSLRSNP